MSTTFEPALKLALVHAHPKNPRHSAIADEDMVASIREQGLVQPVVVAPHPTKAKAFVLIAGHRRIDGATKAKREHVPAIVRDDLVTEGQQIEAMVIENGHREDLTPIEEAEGYAQLQLLGYKPAQIAAAVGRNIKTVRTRLDLLKLSGTTQGKVHAGQLTLEDAVAIGEFADDPAVVKELENAATSGNLKYALTNAQQRRDRIQKNAALVAQLLDAGATEYTLPGDQKLWQLVQDCKLGRVGNLPEDWAEHTNCLAYVEAGTGNWPSVDIVCTKPLNHKTDIDAKAAAREAEREAERREREAVAAARNSASAARVSTLIGLVGTDTKMPPQLVDLARVLIPHVLADPNYEATTYADALDIPEADRWDGQSWTTEGRARYRTLLAQHCDEELAKATPGYLTRALVALLVSFAEFNLDAVDDRADLEDVSRVRDYYGLLDQAGYTLTPVDESLLEVIAEVEAGESE